MIVMVNVMTVAWPLVRTGRQSFECNASLWFDRPLLKCFFMRRASAGAEDCEWPDQRLQENDRQADCVARRVTAQVCHADLLRESVLSRVCNLRCLRIVCTSWTAHTNIHRETYINSPFWQPRLTTIFWCEGCTAAKHPKKKKKSTAITLKQESANGCSWRKSTLTKSLNLLQMRLLRKQKPAML